MFPYDFRDDRMMKQLKEITQRIISIYPELHTDVASLTHNLINKVINNLNNKTSQFSKKFLPIAIDTLVFNMIVHVTQDLTATCSSRC